MTYGCSLQIYIPGCSTDHPIQEGGRGGGGGGHELQIQKQLDYIASTCMSGKYKTDITLLLFTF